MKTPHEVLQDVLQFDGDEMNTFLMDLGTYFYESERAGKLDNMNACKIAELLYKASNEVANRTGN